MVSALKLRNEEIKVGHHVLVKLEDHQAEDANGNGFSANGVLGRDTPLRAAGRSTG
jgi:hypothetical protein